MENNKGYSMQKNDDTGFWEVYRVIFGEKWKIATFDSISDAIEYMGNKKIKEEERKNHGR